MESTKTNRNRIYGLLLVFTMLLGLVLTMNVFAYDNVAQIYDSTYGQNGNNNNNVNINFNRESYVQSNFTHSTVTNDERLYVNEDGTYKITYSCVWNATGGNNNRRIYENYILINGTKLTPSESDVYIRGPESGSQSGGSVSSTSAVVLATIGAGGYIELRGGEDTGDTNNGNTITEDDCFMTAQKLNTRAIKVYDGAGTQTVSGVGSEVVVNLDTTYYNGDSGLYSLNSDRVNVSEDGWYKVSYTSCLIQNTGTSGAQRESPQSWIRRNGNENISLSFSYAGYTRRQGAGADKNCNRASTLINLSSGDYIELQTGIFDSENGNTMQLIQDQSWMIVEKMTLDTTLISINNSGQQITHLNTDPVTFDLNDKIGDYITHTGSNSRITFDKAGLYEISYNIGYQDSQNGRVVTCGQIRRNGNEYVTPSRQCIYTRGDAQAKTGTVSTTTLLNVSENDYIEIMITPIIGQSGDEDVILQKGTTWIMITKINETATFEWNNNVLDLGDTNVSQGDLTGSESFTITGENHSNVLLACVSGDCDVITNDFDNRVTKPLNIALLCATSACADANLDVPYYNNLTAAGHNVTNHSATSFSTAPYDLLVISETVNSGDTAWAFNENIGVLTVEGSNWDEMEFGTSGDSTTGGTNGNIVDNTHFITKDYPTGAIALSNGGGGIGRISGWGAGIRDLIVFDGAPANGWLLVAEEGATLDDASTAPGKRTFFAGQTASQKTQDSWDLFQNAVDWTANNMVSYGGLNFTDSVTFTCDDGQIGSYWAEYKIYSDEFPQGDTINVTCDVNQTYGHIDLVLDTPTTGSQKNVIQNTTFEINATVTCAGPLDSTCGNIELYARYNNSLTTFTDISTTPTTPMWTSSTNPQYCALDRGDSCTVSWIVNGTGTINSLHLIDVNATSNFTQVPYNQTGNATINITVLPPDSIIWDLSTLNLGSSGLNLGNVNNTAKIIASGNHSNITISCLSGNCSYISDNWVDYANLSDGNENTITFTCDDGEVGNFWALFGVNSSEDPEVATINTSCTITQTYGYLNVTLIYPPENQITIVPTLQTFNVNATVICEGTTGALCGNVSLNARYGDKSLDYGDGSEGSVTISSPNTIVNNYTYLTGNENIGEINITVNDASEFAVGDEILIIQMQDASGGVAGTYEFRDIDDINGNIITIDTNLTNSYASGTFGTTSSTATQVVRVAQYSDLTISSSGSITSPAWNGFVGGIVVIRSQDFINTTGYINVSDRGFRGGTCGACNNNVFGTQGEGTTGIGTTSTGSNANGGGGGDGSAGDGSPGGGGGYGTNGGNGIDDSGSDSSGGNTAGILDLSLMLFGGGAGAGGDVNSGAPEDVDGGGIAIVFSKNIYDAKIHAQGEDAVGANHGVSGGGAGGTIWLGGNLVNITNVSAIGGASASANSDTGGAGGDGRIRIDYLEQQGITAPTAGYTNSNFSEVTTLIRNLVGSEPFRIIGDEVLYCPATLYEGNVCSLEFTVNVTAETETTYKINVNVSSNQSQVFTNESLNATVLLDNIVVITVNSPTNNTKYLSTDILYANIDSSYPIIYAGYYLDGDIGNIVDLENNSDNTTWTALLENLSYGLHNITFIYNETSLIQNTTGTYFFTTIKGEWKKVDKGISNFGTDFYLNNIYITDLANQTENTTYLDFVDESFSFGNPTPGQDFNFSVTGQYYDGSIYAWNLTTIPLSINKINYSTGGILDYRLLDNFLVGLE